MLPEMDLWRKTGEINIFDRWKFDGKWMIKADDLCRVFPFAKVWKVICMVYVTFWTHVCDWTLKRASCRVMCGLKSGLDVVCSETVLGWIASDVILLVLFLIALMRDLHITFILTVTLIFWMVTFIQENAMIPRVNVLFYFLITNSKIHWFYSKIH